MQEQQQSEQAVAQYRIAQNEFNILKMRLDTQPILDQIEYFMRGARWTIEQAPDGKIQTKKITMGVPKANDLGIQSVLNWLTSTINPQTVQGNFPVDKHGYSQMYENYIFEFQVNFGNYIDGYLFTKIYWHFGIYTIRKMPSINSGYPFCYFCPQFLILFTHASPSLRASVIVSGSP